MTAVDFLRVKAVLNEVRELVGAERTARLEALCAGDEVLRNEALASLNKEGE